MEPENQTITKIKLCAAFVLAQARSYLLPINNARDLAMYKKYEKKPKKMGAAINRCGVSLDQAAATFRTAKK